jgi:hypothetical protein
MVQPRKVHVQILPSAAAGDTSATADEYCTNTDTVERKFQNK